MLRMVWKKAAEIGINARIPLNVSVYHSNRSKLRVVVADVTGPMVRGHISFVTEANTDDGLPHTLEHLVFMGSKNYPYKGILDVIANRCLASGTNAHTDQDHTAYTLDTAGSSGFLKVLPVYLDHLLAPTLTDSQFTTEVHHIDGQGHDSGVVYSEMQDHESEMERLVDQKRKNLFYPPGSSYAADTGGRLLNLRQSCTNEKVRQYHKDFYHLNNMVVTVSGMIDHEKLLKAIEPIEEQNLMYIPANFTRPFQSRVTKIEPRDARIVCPSDEEDIGMVEMSWLGPAGAELYTIRAMLILADYLTDTSGAPLKRDFVQVADPYCSSVHISLMEQTDCELIATFSGVPFKKLEAIQDRFFTKTVADHAEPSAFDMQRIGFILEQQSRSFLSKLENNAHSFIKDSVVGHQLYGEEGESDYKQLAERLNDVDVLSKLKMESAEFWHKLFHKYFTRQCVCVKAEPSEKEVEEVMAKEEKRIKEQVEKLGPEGLAQQAKRLADAIEENTKNKPPPEVLEQLIVRDLEQFYLIPVKTLVSADGSANEKDNGLFIHKLPFHTFLHQVKSDFFEANILIDTDQLSAEDRSYLMLWSELMFQSPALVDGKELSYEEVAKLATRDLVSNQVSVGVSGVYDRFMSLKLRVDAPHHENLAKWAEIYLRGIRFDPTRALICAKKLANKAADNKRAGDVMVHFLNTASTYAPDSNTHIFGYLALEKFHQQLAKTIEKGADASEKVIARLEQVRNRVLSSPLNVHFAGDAEKLPPTLIAEEPKRWQFLVNDTNSTSRAALQCPPDYGQRWTDSIGKTRVVTVGGSESAFLLQKAQFDGDWLGPNTMETLLLCQYLCQCEGPLWNAVRGTGLAYDASVYLLPDRRAITLNLYRCAQLGQAYERTRETVLSILDSGKLDNSQFEAAKRSLVCELVGGQSTVKLTTISAMLARIRNIPLDFTQLLCSRIWHASVEDVLTKGSPAVRRLFDSGTAVRSIAMNTSRLAELREQFPGVEVLKLEKLQIQSPK